MNHRPSLRPGGPSDSRAVFDVFLASLADLGARLGVETITGGAEAADSLWEKRRSLFEHVAATADRFWVAEANGRIVGYARSTLRDGVRQLTEFFVRPDAQSAGLGGALLARVLPADGARGRILLATPDPRALGRYLRAGLQARFPVFHFHRPRLGAALPHDLSPRQAHDTPQHLAQFAALDRQVLGFRRDADHRWLLAERTGWFFLRDGQPVGYGYTGGYSGPFAALDPADLGPMLAYAEWVAPGAEFGVEVPLISPVARDYLLPRGFRMEPFVNYFMSDAPLGQFDRYLPTTPSVFL